MQKTKLDKIPYFVHKAKMASRLRAGLRAAQEADNWTKRRERHFLKNDDGEEPTTKPTQ
jgi:hypothetical protein